MRNILFVMFLLFLSPSFAFNESPLPVDQAFIFSTKIGPDQQILAHWQIAPGYYLYKNRFNIHILSPRSAKLAPIDFPNGIPKEDDIFGKYQVYFNTLTLPISINAFKNGQLKLQIGYQGCSKSGFCYPPVTKIININFADLRLSIGDQPMISEQDKITSQLAQHNIGLSLLIFFGFGLLLTFTPCVLPMIPILSSLIIEQGRKIKTRHAFGLSLSYVLGMAVTFAAAGVAAGLIGSSLQATFQKPWVIILFSFFFVLLALSLFGFYEIQIPHVIRKRVLHLSDKQQSGTYIGVTIMGVLSALIISPCVSAPLIGALSYIGKTGDAFLGGLTLFAMGLGMGVPLIIFGTIEGSLLPKAGNWMNAIKSFFGVLLLAVAIWMLERVLPGQVIMFFWAALLIISSIFLGAFSKARSRWQLFWKGVSFLILIYGFLLMVGGAMGNTNPLHPLALSHHFGQPTQPPKANGLFKRVSSLADVQREIINAKRAGKKVLLDFYADWCISCKIMERDTFSDPYVQRALAEYVLLQADITKNNPRDKTLLHHYNVIAPPAILFFDTNGKEIKPARIVGEKKPKAFIEHLEKLD